MLNIKIIFKYAFKDLSRQKIRTIIGVLGIMISVALLSIVLFLSDSISVTFIDYLSIDAGNQDMVISVRHYNGEPEDRSDYFDYGPLIESIQGNIEGIEDFIPRMELWGEVNISQGIGTTELTNSVTSVLLSGINFSLENELGFGTFVKQETNEILDLNSLPLNHCAIYYEFNEEIQYAKNDIIEIRMSLTHGNVTYDRKTNFTIDAIFDFQFKWPISYQNRPLIVVDIESLYEIFGSSIFNGKCDSLILTLESGNIFYDARDIEGSENRVKDLAGDIQLLIGINEYYIDLPKLEVLGFSEFLSVGITIIFVFVSMISMIISGVLINGILKTSVEERIREFGIFRTLGATKKYNLSIVLVQGLLLCNFGTISGIFVAVLSTRFIILPIAEVIVAQNIPGLAGNISFFVAIWSILISYLIGLAVGLIVSISPAIRVMKLQLIESIHPYRHEDTLYHLQKKATVNYKLIIVGMILAANGAFVLFVIPRILISADISLMAGTLIALLIVSFVIFTASATRFLSDQVAIGANLGYGSDLVIETRGWYDPEESIEDPFGGSPIALEYDPLLVLQNDDYAVNPNRILTSDFENEVLKVEGIEKISSVIASPFHLTQIYSEEGKEFTAEIGDYAGLFTQEISLIGIDEEYPSTIKTKFIEFTQGDLSSSFNLIFNIQDFYKCIISEGLSENLDLNKGDLVRMAIQRGDESQIYTFQIAGVAASMPGFSSQFGRSSASAQMGGVMISQDVYIEIMDIPPIPYLDKIFIKLSLNRQRPTQNIIDDIISYGVDYDFEITDVERAIRQQQSLFSILDTFFMMTLDATIVICLFGLLSSSYSTIIERKKDIGIIRTLGLKGKEINKLFTMESLIIMLSSGTVGVIVGWLTGLLLSTSINLLSDLPNIPTFPITNMLSVYIISIIFVLIGMKILLRKIRKKKIVEIYRETM
ncbi:hypothetical protein AC481_00025 [miscellaneous Crenarchaeota group archaeon SMTZ-80]|nr:MAG: hypothetical protein AC481_00025 [miscellaneous Crenarchaeota group archaeon SMTZ-80]